MRQKVVPGAELDVLTQEEMRALLKAELRTGVFERVVQAANGPLTAGGVGSIDAYTVPVGMEFRLCRVVVTADGFNYAAMFTNAAGGVTLLRDGQLVDGFNLSLGLPNVWTAGSGSAPRFRNGQKVTVAIVGGPASANVTVNLEGDLFPERVPASA